MRIVTWNCCRGPAAAKLALLGALAPSISIVQECPRPIETTPSCLWFGDNPRQGIAVTASDGYAIAPAELRDVPRYTVPIQVTGPASFLLLVVWAKTDLHYRYVKGVIRAVECYRDLIVQQPTVVVGDFNSNTIWDHKRANDQNHSALVRKLAALGLESAYHSFFGELHGAETRPTFFLLKNQARPYHIDYCFIPRPWISLLQSVHIDTHDGWSKASDHRPLVIDLEMPRTV